jgi:hypothetical protein
MKFENLFGVCAWKFSPYPKMDAPNPDISLENLLRAQHRKQSCTMGSYAMSTPACCQAKELPHQNKGKRYPITAHKIKSGRHGLNIVAAVFIRNQGREILNS